MTYQKKSLIIKIIVFVFLSLIVIFPPEDSPSLETKTAVNVAAFDRSGEKTQVYVQMNIPQQMAQGSSKLLVVKEDGKNIAQALDNLSVKIGQDIELAHCGIIIIGEQMAKTGFTDDLDYLLSSGKISPQITMFNCEGKAEDFMSKLNEFSQTNGSAVFDVAAFSENSINVRTVSALTFLSENHLPSASSTLPLIGFEMQSGGGEDGGGYDSGAGQSQQSDKQSGEQSGKKQNTPELKELHESMLYKNGKAVKKLSAKATKGLSIFDSKSHKGYFEITDVVIGDHLVSYVPMRVLKKQGKLVTNFNGGPKAVFDVNVKLEVETGYVISKLGKYASEQAVKEALTKKAEEIIQSEIAETLSDCLDSGADALGIETAFYKQNGALYKFYGDKNQFVKNVQVEYKIKAEVV